MFSLFQRLLGSNRSARRRSRVRPPHGFAPRLEALEDRLLLSLGSPFNVAVGNQQNESANASWAGGSVVVWSEPRPGGTDRDVKAQILDTAGNPMFSVVTVAGTPANEHKPAVAVDDQGNFVVAWTKDISASDSDVQVRRFDKTGTPTAQLGTASSVPVSTVLKEYDASVAMAADGEFVVSYTQEDAGSKPQNVAAADYFFSSPNTYSATPTVFNVAKDPALDESESSVARVGNTFAIAYESGPNPGFAPFDTPGGPLAQGNVYLRPYVQGTGGMVASSTSAAVPVSSSGLSAAPSVALDSFNEAVVAWQETLTAGSKLTVRATKFNSAWAPVAVTLSDGTSTTTLNVQGPSGVDYVFPSVVLNSANGNFAVAYQSGIYGNNVHVQVTEVTFSANSSTPSLTTMATLGTTDLGATRSLPALSIRPASGDYLLTYTNQSSTPTFNGIVGGIGTALTPSSLTPAVFGRSPQTGQVVALIPTSTTAAGASIWATFDPTVTWVDFLSGDFNGDGKPDLAARKLVKGDWYVAINNGSSFTLKLWDTWTGTTSSSDPDPYTSVLVGDFNGDGKADIVGRAKQVIFLPNPDPKGPPTDVQNVYVSLTRADASGGTTTLWDQWKADAGPNPGDVRWQDVLVGDFNGDGKADLVGGIFISGNVATPPDGHIEFRIFRDIFVAESNGSSFSQHYWHSWDSTITWANVVVGNFTGDGKAGLAARVLENGALFMSVDYTPAAVRGFGGQKYWQQWLPPINWTNVLVGDVDGSGKDDLVARDAVSGVVFVSLNFDPTRNYDPAKGGTADPQQDWKVNLKDTQANPWVDFQVADFSGDGKADFVARLQTSGAWYLFRSTGSQQLGFTQAFYGLWNPQGNWTNVSLGVN